MKVNPEFDYAEAHSQDRWTILGVSLLPFQFGHKLALLRGRSPFFDSKIEFNHSHLIFALWVCSRKSRDSEKGLSLLWKLWAFWVAWKMKRDETLFYSRVEMFFKYLSEAHKLPAKMRKTGREGGGEQETTHAPSLMVIKRDLMSKHGFSHDEVMELPLRLATYERFAELEDEGLVSWPAGWEAGQ